MRSLTTHVRVQPRFEADDRSDRRMARWLVDSRCATDASGFAAMGVGETLLHTNDIAVGFDLPWNPPARLCRFVLDRLFPGHPDGPAHDVLLWLTGRQPLGDQPPQVDWVWHAAI